MNEIRMLRWVMTVDDYRLIATLQIEFCHEYLNVISRPMMTANWKLTTI